MMGIANIETESILVCSFSRQSSILHKGALMKGFHPTKGINIGQGTMAFYHFDRVQAQFDKFIGVIFHIFQVGGTTNGRIGQPFLNFLSKETLLLSFTGRQGVFGIIMIAIVVPIGISLFPGRSAANAGDGTSFSTFHHARRTGRDDRCRRHGFDGAWGRWGRSDLGAIGRDTTACISNGNDIGQATKTISLVALALFLLFAVLFGMVLAFFRDMTGTGSMRLLEGSGCLSIHTGVCRSLLNSPGTRSRWGNASCSGQAQTAQGGLTLLLDLHLLGQGGMTTFQ
mmetsp:Transcript_12080/g.24968  ORF Transcript_12080/g.24968 Transcript_12080/m.24968 type:complete len:284 (+) Transcript_12080:246-1097(+)